MGYNTGYLVLGFVLGPPNQETANYPSILPYAHVLQ